MQVMQSLIEIMPKRQALDYCMRAKQVTAQTAFEMGLITQLSSDTNIDEDVKVLIDDIKEQSPSAIRLGLKAADELKAVPKQESHIFLHEKLMEVLQTKDAAEGITAFAEKRKPVWKGE